MTYDELAETLNTDKVFSKYFEVTVKAADTEVGGKSEGTGLDKGDTYYDYRSQGSQCHHPQDQHV